MSSPPSTTPKRRHGFINLGRTRRGQQRGQRPPQLPCSRQPAGGQKGRCHLSSGFVCWDVFIKAGSISPPPPPSSAARASLEGAAQSYNPMHNLYLQVWIIWTKRLFPSCPDAVSACSNLTVLNLKPAAQMSALPVFAVLNISSHLNIGLYRKIAFAFLGLCLCVCVCVHGHELARKCHCSL